MLNKALDPAAGKDEMAMPLLMTKLYIPPPRPRLVSRPRLVRLLDEGLGLGRRLSLISAPAGFGKTTLATEWLYGDYPHISPRAVAWLSLDEGDNDPERFFTYLVASLRQIDGAVGGAVQDLLGSPQPPPTGSLMTLLANDLSAITTPFVLVLDDVQMVRSEPVHGALAFLLDHQPPPLHLVLVTREEPPLPLARLRARGQVTEIRERDLRFTAGETAAFLNRTMDLSLSPEAVRSLEARTEGWITGLQLAALALHEQPDPDRAGALIEAFTGDDRYVVDYLLAEVLHGQPQSVRDFLRQTAILDRLTAPLCTALTGREDSQSVLEQLDAANLFLTALDHRREWYRYHRLFAQFLRATLEPEERQGLHRRAARWYEAHGYLGLAIRHALACAEASGDWEDAQRLILQASEGTLHGGGLLTVGGWLEALPRERVRADGELATYQGWVSALTGDLDRAEECAALAGARLEEPAAPAPTRARLLVLQAFLAVFGRQDYGSAIELATRALDMLPPDQARWRIIALWALAESQERTRDITEAIATLRQARRTWQAQPSQVFAVTVELFLATALHTYGQRREAIAVCVDAIAACTDEAGRTSPVAGMLFSLLGTLYYEADRIEEARRYVDRGLALCEQLALDGSLIFAYGTAAATLQAQGETNLALDMLHRAHQIAARGGLVDPGAFAAREADIRLRQGDLPAALRWARATGLSPDATPDYLHIEAHIVYARLLLARGRLPEAQRWLARLEGFARERSLNRWLLTIHLLQAQARVRLGDRPGALEALSQALALAAPQDYLRAFLEEGPEIGAHLPQVRHLAPAFVDRILDRARAYPAAAAPPPLQPLVEPLSERELEVLRLIAGGLTNREIAGRLFIAVGTVKRHINNIYGKLQVRRRAEAIARARDLGLV